MSVTHIPVANRSPFEYLADGVEVSRSIADSGICDLGGGHFRFVDDGELEGTLEYDEVVYVLAGAVSVTVSGETAKAAPGDILILTKGSTATYRASAGSEVFYVIYPKHH